MHYLVELPETMLPELEQWLKTKLGDGAQAGAGPKRIDPPLAGCGYFACMERTRSFYQECLPEWLEDQPGSEEITAWGQLSQAEQNALADRLAQEDWWTNADARVGAGRTRERTLRRQTQKPARRQPGASQTRTPARSQTDPPPPGPWAGRPMRE